MKPGTARGIMVVVLLFAAIAGVVTVNLFFGGSFLYGLLIIILPLLLLAFLLPRWLPVKCPKCGAGMRFQHIRPPVSGADEPEELYGYRCASCREKYLWEGASSGSTLG